MANELPRAERFIFDRLLEHNVAGGRIYSGVAPQGAQAPYVVMSMQSPGTYRRAVNQDRVLLDPLFWVRAIAETRSWSTLQTIADAIDRALDGTSGSVDGARILRCFTENPLSTMPEEDGEQYRILGGMYRVLIQEAT